METAAEAGLAQHLGEAALVSSLATVTTDSLSQAGLTPVEHEQKPMVGRKIYFSPIGSLEESVIWGVTGSSTAMQNPGLSYFFFLLALLHGIQC